MMMKSDFPRWIWKNGEGGVQKKGVVSVLKVYRFPFFTPHYLIVFIIKYRNRVVSVLKNDIYACTRTRTRKVDLVFLVHLVHLFVVCAIILSIYVGVNCVYLVHVSTRNLHLVARLTGG